MIRRIVVGVLALMLAAIGGVLTYVYAAGADARALARLQPVQVLVVAEPIPEGTPTEAISRSLAVAEVPGPAVVPGALTDLSLIEGQVTTADLQPGEQLLASRFAAPEAVPGDDSVPAGMHQLTILLEPRRVIGGELRAGDAVGVFASAADVSQTRLILHKVLVVDVVGGITTATDEQGQEIQQGPAEAIMVTLALSAPDSELVVYAAEYDRIWLSIEPEDASEEGTRIVTPEVIRE